MAITGQLFYLALLIGVVVVLIRHWKAKKQAAILDEELSRKELARKRRMAGAKQGVVRDYFATLGVSDGASQEEISRAWRRKAGEFSPETSHDLTDFEQCLDAHETLCGRRSLLEDYRLYLDEYLCAWLTLSNRIRGFFVRLHGILLIWLWPFVLVGGPLVVYSYVSGRGKPHVILNLTCTLAASGLFIAFPHLPFIGPMRIWFLDWYSRRRALRRITHEVFQHQLATEFPSERLHRLTRKLQKIEKAAIKIAGYRYGYWLLVLFKMCLVFFCLTVKPPKNGSIREGLLCLAVCLTLLIFVYWRFSWLERRSA